jgi:hypothetical protein
MKVLTMTRPDLSLATLRRRYLDGSLTPSALVHELHRQAQAEDALVDRRVWIRRLTLDEMLVHATALAGRDPATLPPHGPDFGAARSFSFGVPRADDLEFHGNADGPRLFAQAVDALCQLGGSPVEIERRPFRAVATLLYEGPWVAERYAAIRSFIERQPQSLHPVTRRITEAGVRIDAPAAFEAMYRLKALQRETQGVWERIDCRVTPTAGTIYTVAEVEADPIRLNANLGHYTNFVNLLGLAAVAVPTGVMARGAPQPDHLGGLPWGVTLVAPAGKDLPLLSLAARLHARTLPSAGATAHASPTTARRSSSRCGHCRRRPSAPSSRAYRPRWESVRSSWKTAAQCRASSATCWPRARRETSAPSAGGAPSSPTPHDPPWCSEAHNARSQRMLHVWTCRRAPSQRGAATASGRLRWHAVCSIPRAGGAISYVTDMRNPFTQGH